jgi:hypothetical protein
VGEAGRPGLAGWQAASRRVATSKRAGRAASWWLRIGFAFIINNPFKRYFIQITFTSFKTPREGLWFPRKEKTGERGKKKGIRDRGDEPFLTKYLWNY